MELHNVELKPISDVLTLNMDDDQYAFENRIKTFDPNLSSVAQYSPTPSTSTAVNPYNVQPNETVVSIPDQTSTNCVTYSNIIFLPTNSTNGLDQVVELVKNENHALTSDCINGHTFKYIVSSDQRFMNTYIRTSDIDDANHTSNSYIDQTSSNMIAIAQNNLILNNACPTEPHNEQLNLENHSLAVQVQPEYSHIEQNGTEIIMQAPDGQLYRPVHNIFLNNEQTSGDEILPTIISEPLTFTDIEFTQPNQFDPDTFHNNVSSDHGNYQVPTSFMEANPSLGTAIVYNEYKGSKMPNEQFQMDHVNVLEPNQMPQYQTNPVPQVDKDRQRILLESTMSPLLAAVNITSREEQFQSYEAENDSASASASSANYYTNSDMANMGQSPTQYSTAKINNPMRTVACVSKSHSTSTESSSTNEFVDYSEVKLLRNKEEGKAIPAKRAKLRKKTTKKRDDELSVADRFVPSRAVASLPTSHLYFELQADNNDGQTNRIVFTKREIPVRTKFGPFEGNTKSLNKDELNKYRKLKTSYPLLFVGPKTILDVSNENTSNWMRFVQLAKTYAEQNLQLYEYDSRLFFKASQAISSKRDLLVGYSKEYAEKYNLPQMLPDEYIEDGKKSNEWHCSKCKKQFATIDLLQSHLEFHKLNVTPPKNLQITPIRSTPSKSSESGSPVKSKHRLNTDAIRLRKLAQSRNSRTSGPTVRYACCYCSKVFSKFLNYKRHTNDVHSVDIEHKRFSVDIEHKRLTVEDSSSSKENDAKLAKIRENIENETKNRTNELVEKWFVCQICQESFDSSDLLEKHRLKKCIKKESLSGQCSICSKNFKNPAALIMHMKTHGEETEIFQCIYCPDVRYKKSRLLKEHVNIHMKNDQYSCPHDQCSKTCPKYSSIRKHIRTVHSSIKFQCNLCESNFNSKYKLKEHSFIHSGIKQHLCADCGKQFKRKDKLREHIFRMHASLSQAKSQKLKAILPSTSKAHKDSSPNTSSFSESSESTNSKSTNVPNRVKFQPKVSPTDYQRFIYKCVSCMVGFKRRGMLVNHMAKLHPGVPVDSVHELSLPILKTQRCFYCLHCDKKYASSTKRKAHILKNHPGQPLPESTRGQNQYENVNATNSSFSQNIGQITTRAHQCMWCYKQYAARNRLLQHQREVHKDQMRDPYADDSHEYYRDQSMWPVQHSNHFQTYELRNSEYPISHTHTHTHHHTQRCAEPENKLLRLSSAALEASIRDDVSFLETHNNALNEKLTNNLTVGDSILPKVDVNFKIGDEYVDAASHTQCDLNPFPQLFEGIDYMTLKSTNFNSSNEHNSSGDSIGKVDFSN